MTSIILLTTYSPFSKADIYSGSNFIGAEEDLSNPNLTESNNINTNNLVGEIPLISDNNEFGAKTYQVTIDVAPGINGFQPNIALYYNSLSNCSPIGMGWSIMGLSQIVRSGKNRYYDNKSEGVVMNNSDSFILDGTRLIKIEKEETNYILFQSEQGNIKAKGHIDGGYIKYFEVFYPNGNKGIFGEINNSSDNILYPITSLKDINNNEIIYEYLNSDNYYYIKKISYNGCSVEFYYNYNNTPYVSTYIGGKRIDIKYLINGIYCRNQSVVLRNYNLNHNYYLGVPLLNQISMSCTDGNLNPLKFYYGNENSSIGSYSKYSSKLSEWNAFEYPGDIRTIQGRFDYVNKYPGIISLPLKNSYVKKYRKADTFHHTENYFENEYNGSENIFIHTVFPDSIANTTETISTGTGFVDLLCSDINGSQCESIIRINNYVSNGLDKIDFNTYSYLSDGKLYKGRSHSFSFPTIFQDNAKNQSIQPKYYFSGDFNGDGKMEILAVSAENPFGETERPSKCYIFDISSGKILFDSHIFSLKIQFDAIIDRTSYPFDFITDSDMLVVIDYDGDGKSDLCHINDIGMSVYTFDENQDSLTCRLVNVYTGIKKSMLKDRDFLAGDINGDGLTDLALSPLKKLDGGKQWNIFYSIGNGNFNNDSFSCVGITPNVKTRFMLHDIDGDGKSDLVKWDLYNIETYFFNNDKTIRKTSFENPSKKSVVIPLNSKNLHSNLILLQNEELCQYSYTINKTKEILLTKAVNSFGVEEITEYGPINNEGLEVGLYKPSSLTSFPYVSLIEPLHVCAKTEVFLNNESIDTKLYEYTSAIFHLQGKGFCGFNKIKTIDSKSQSSIKEYDPYNLGVLMSEETPMSKIFYYYDFYFSSNKVSNIQLKSKYEIDFLNNTNKTTKYRYDSYGNPIEEITETSDNYKVKTSLEYYNVDNVDESQYNLGFVTNRMVERTTPNGDTYTEEEIITSYEKRLPLIRISNKGDNQIERKSFEYDVYGNCLKESASAYNSSNILTQSYSFDVYGRLIKSVNPLGLSTLSKYNDLGLECESVDPRGNKTYYIYDGLGREKKIIYADDREKTITYSWETSIEGALYSITESETGQPTTKKYFDALNREVREEKTRFDESVIKIDKKYDARGNLIAESLPFKGNSASLWILYNYDNYDRILQKSEPNGKSLTYSYSQNIKRVDDGLLLKTYSYDTSGNLISIHDGDCEIKYCYFPDGEAKYIDIIDDKRVCRRVLEFEYDDYYRLKKQKDSSLGVSTISYDDTGNISKKEDANGNITEFVYDCFGRIIKRKCPEFETDYAYNEYNEMLSKISSNGSSKSFTYDNFGRLIIEKEVSTSGVWLQKSHSFLDGNKVSTNYETNNGTLTTETFSYLNGHLVEAKIASGETIYKLVAENSYGQPTHVITNNVSRFYEYDEFGIPTRRFAESEKNIYQDEEYNFDIRELNLLSRTDNIYDITEDFEYDKFNRLSYGNSKGISYHSNGKIKLKDGLGLYAYGNDSNPYAVTSVIPIYPDDLPQKEQEIKYNSLSRASRIKEGGHSVEIEYNDDGERVRMLCYGGNRLNIPDEKCYLGNCYEYKGNLIAASSFVEKLYLMGDYYSAPSVLIKLSPNEYIQDIDTISHEIGPFEPALPYEPLSNYDTLEAPSGPSVVCGLHQILRDYLGSIVNVIQPDGTNIQTLKYDAWGRLRDPESLDIYPLNSQPKLYLERGYSGHEHLTQFNLINMNGRLYDPLISMFLSPDPNIYNIEDTQSFNRYSYALNNPFKFNDKTGESVCTIMTCLSDLAYNIFTRGVNFDHYNWKRTRNSWKIDVSMYQGNFFQVLNKFTYNIFNSFVGMIVAHTCNYFGAVDRVTTLDGMTAVGGVTGKSNNITGGGKAFTIGHFSMGPKGYTATWKDHLFVHEYGHYIQSQYMGIIYFFKVAIPSLISASNSKTVYDSNGKSYSSHDLKSFEMEASKLGAMHFANKYGRGSGKDYFNLSSFVKGLDSPYNNPRTGDKNRNKNPIFPIL